MVNQQGLQRTSYEWLRYAKEISAANTAQRFTVNDRLGSPLIIEWTQADILSPVLAQFKKSHCELACQALAPMEVQFLHAHPEAVSQELFLRACAPLFEHGPEAVDWQEVETTIQSAIRQFYLMDLSSFGEALIKPLLDDVYFLVSVKTAESNERIGFAMFAVTPALSFGNVKLINIAYQPQGNDRGLDLLLMSSIFAILPQTERIFLYTRPTNTIMLENYAQWGFARDFHPEEDPNHKVNEAYLMCLEYRTENSSALQETAETFLRTDE